MTEQDVFEFSALTKRVGSVYRMKADTPEFRGVQSSYFRALQRFPLAALERAADRWIETQPHFPKPVEWARTASEANAPVAIAIAELSATEAREWLRAERQRWSDEPCGCYSCVERGVTAYRLRFVPEVDKDDREVRVRIGDRIVVQGHWAHGDELARYYLAHETFWSAAKHFVASKAWPVEGGEWNKRRQWDRAKP